MWWVKVINRMQWPEQIKIIAYGNKIHSLSTGALCESKINQDL